jgi:phosphatidate phosphatase LPIN
LLGIVVAEELKENEVIDQIHAIPSVPIKKNNLSPKNNTNCLTVHDIRSSLHYNSVELSLCLSEILKNPEKAEEIFLNKMIKKEEFFKDPWKYLNNSNLLICYEDKLYTYKTAIPIILSLLTYGELPPQDTINELSLNGGLFGFFRSNKNQAQLNNIKVHIEHKDDMNLVSEKKEITRKESLSKLKRSFIPTSDQLKLLNLKYGRNEIKFVCQSRLSGVQSLSADIYLWDHESKIVISDIDGTITRSDVLGQIMPMIGKDWSHEGVTDLFTNIDKNGYKILYLTARAICQASATKNYIQTLFQSKFFFNF